ncbi:MAG TPA: hypothetical protein VL173_01475 [Vicinamibacterales bacterium]|jgi:hypothetical protein|nr:hypothetical protein [Vicinamibacterales bacterium]
MSNRSALRYSVVEWALSAMAVTIVALAVLAMDTPARDYLHGMAASTRAADFAPRVPQPVADAGRSVWQICEDHGPLAGFAGVAVLLVVFMRQMR